MQAKVFDKKIQKVYADIDFEKLQKNLSQKVGKEELANKMEEYFGKMGAIEK